jgi:undecaprenyl-diphosphatase
MDKLIQLDHTLLFYINNLWSNSFFDALFPGITDLHKTLIFNLVMYPLFIGLFYWKYKKQGFLIFFGLILCLGFSDIFGNYAIKKNVQRPRPADTPGVEVIVRSPSGGFSFTSNHATNMFALATYTTRFIPGMWPTYIFAALIAYSRVYNGAHFPLDVIVGGILGTLWGFLFSALLKKILKRRTSA